MNIPSRLNGVAGRLLELVDADSTHQAPDCLEVPITEYTDPDRFNREVDLLFKRLPQFLGFSAELLEPGMFKTIDLMEVPILVTRQEDGSVRAFLNVCQHRGAVLVEQPHGRAKRFACRYHGWSYKNDGDLLAIAGKSKFGNPDVSCRNLRELACYERAGMIFGVLTPGVETDFEAFFAGFLDEVAFYELEKWHYLGTDVLDGANWKVAFDGFLETYHFQTTHPKTVATVSINNVMDVEAFGPHLRAGIPNKTLLDLNGTDAADWYTHEREHFRTLRLLFPNLSMSLSYGIAQVLQILPGRSWNESHLIMHRIVPQKPAGEVEVEELEKAGEWLTAVVRDEDYTLGRQVQRGLSSGAMDSVIFGRNEIGNQHFHRWVAHYLDGATGQPPAL